MNDFFPILCELFVKGLAVLALASGINACWRGASAAFRHLIWLLAFGSLLALPLTRMAAPVWTVPLSHTETISPDRISEPVALAAPSELSVVPAQSRKLPSWRALLTFAWLAGALAVVGYRISGELRLRRLRRESKPLFDSRLQDLAQAIARESGLRSGPELRFSATSVVPLTWGVCQPVVLLPEAALAWPEGRLAMALRHELAHVQRGDCLARFLAHLACAFHWPNPLVWLAARRLRLAQEHACDDLVLLGGASSSGYADFLVQTARSLQTNRQFGRYALAMAQPTILEARVRAIVDGKRNRTPLAQGATALGGATVALLLAASALAQVADKAPAQGPQIEIESKFVELSDDALKQVGAEWLMGAKPGGSSVVPPQKLEKLLATLAQTKGVDILANPRVITKPNQQAKIEVGREFVYPSEWEKDKDPGTWKPKSFEMKNVGVSLAIDGTITATGSLELSLEPKVVEFLGFKDLDDDGSRTLSSTQAQVPAGHRTEPLFSTRQVKAVVQIRPAETVVLGGFVRENGQAGAGKGSRHLFVFVTAKIKPPMVGGWGAPRAIPEAAPRINVRESGINSAVHLSCAFLDACDEVGILVQDFHVPYLKKKRSLDA